MLIRIICALHQVIDPRPLIALMSLIGDCGPSKLGPRLTCGLRRGKQDCELNWDLVYWRLHDDADFTCKLFRDANRRLDSRTWMPSNWQLAK